MQCIGSSLIQQFDLVEVEISNEELYKKQKLQPEITNLLKPSTNNTSKTYDKKFIENHIDNLLR